MATTAINPDLLHWAIERSGLPKEELRARFPKLDAWLSGEKQPTFRQLEEFARRTMAPLGVLLLDSPPKEELPLPDFRTHNDKPVKRFSPNLLDTIHAIQQRQAWMRDWLLEEGANELSFVGSLTPSRNVKAAAQRIRQHLDLDPNWAEELPSWEIALKTLRRTIERAGILVFSNSVVGLNNNRKLNPNEFRGFVLCDSLAPTVFLNDADTKSARIFTLAHELTHVWVGQDGVFNLEHLLPSRKKEVELFCNQVAAEFLAPQYKFMQIWSELSHASRRFQMIANKFKVSPVVVARRALDLKLISKPAFFRFYEEDQANWQLVKSKLKKNKGGNFYATQQSRLGRRFSASLVQAVREGKMLYQDAFRLTGMKGKTFHTFADLVRQRVRDEHE